MHIWLLADTSKTGGVEEAMDWELGFIDLLVDSPPPGKPEELKIYGLAERSYDDEIKVCWTFLHFLSAELGPVVPNISVRGQLQLRHSSVWLCSPLRLHFPRSRKL